MSLNRPNTQTVTWGIGRRILLNSLLTSNNMSYTNLEYKLVEWQLTESQSMYHSLEHNCPRYHLNLNGSGT